MTGLPLLRAAVWQTLQDQVGRKRLVKIFHIMDNKRLNLRIVYQTEFAPHKELEFERQWRVFATEVELRITRYLGIPQFGVTGVAIEDEHSRKAKWLDRQHLAKLRQTSAYQRPLRNLKFRL